VIDEKMTVRELRLKKTDLEEKIFNDIRLFTKDTGLNIKDIRCRRGPFQIVYVDVEL